MKKQATKLQSSIFMLSFVIGFLALISAGQNIYTLGNQGGTWTGFIWSIVLLIISVCVIIHINTHYEIKKRLDEETEEF